MQQDIVLQTNNENNKKVQLELVRSYNDCLDETFYRYRTGRYVFWFVQHQSNGKKTKRQNCVGCIFQVSVKSDDSTDFNLIVNTKIGSNLGYPDDFRVDGLPYSLDLNDVDELTSKLLYAKEHLKNIKDFLYGSPHYDLFKKRELLK